MARKRITTAMLQERVRQINLKLGLPEKPWIPGEQKPRTGGLVLDAAYGAVRLAQISPRGGEINITEHRMSNRELWNFLNGMECAITFNQTGEFARF